MQSKPMFHRPELAKRIVSDLAGEGIIDYSSGLFLAAPRRTGKTTFLVNDLVPICQERGWLTVYVDLWANKKVDPAVLISGAIGQALAEREGFMRRAAKKAGIDKITLLRTLNWDFSKPQLPAGVTLAQALEVLSQVSEKPIVLIVDEAQHSLSSEDGVNTMFALKAARDQLNQGSDRIRMVFTGSNRDRLASLVLNSRQPFYGASVTPFPLLGRDFVEHVADFINPRLAKTNQFNVDDLEYAFETVGRRPEMLMQLVYKVSLIEGRADELGELIRAGAIGHRQGIWREYETAFSELSLLQQKLLILLARAQTSNQPFSPFSASVHDEVNRMIELDGGQAISRASIQKAMEVLRERDFVWKAARGDYALEDTAMAEWLDQLTQE